MYVQTSFRTSGMYSYNGLDQLPYGSQYFECYSLPKCIFSLWLFGTVLVALPLFPKSALLSLVLHYYAITDIV